MNVVKSNNTLVILAESHNFIVLTPDFLTYNKIIEDIKEIDRESLFITPELIQIKVKEKFDLGLRNNKLVITSPFGKLPFEIGSSYIKTSPHLQCTAVGINYEYDIIDFESEEWFKKLNVSNYAESIVSSIDYTFNVNDRTVCNVKIVNLAKSEIRLRFNFHTEYKNTFFGELKQDFKADWENNQQICSKFISQTFA